MVTDRHGFLLLLYKQHLESVWGDPFTYRPERWLAADAKQLEKNFIPFSIGPRSCVGRNVSRISPGDSLESVATLLTFPPFFPLQLATMELLVFMSTLFYRCKQSCIHRRKLKQWLTTIHIVSTR